MAINHLALFVACGLGVYTVIQSRGRNLLGWAIVLITFALLGLFDRILL